MISCCNKTFQLYSSFDFCSCFEDRESHCLLGKVLLDFVVELADPGDNQDHSF